MKIPARAAGRRISSARRVGAWMPAVARANGVRALLRAPPLVQRLCTDCNEELQRTPSAAARARGDVSSTVARGVASGGAALPARVRHFFQPRFGHDFGGVRVHTDANAAHSAGALAARAYTYGSNIVFAPGEYSPDTTAGRRLIAHELAHVVQQTGGVQRVQRQPRPQPQPVQVAPTSPVDCQDRTDITADFRQFVRDVPGLIARASWDAGERTRIAQLANLLLHTEGAADIDHYNVISCRRIDNWLLGVQDALAYVDSGASLVGLKREKADLMEAFRRTLDRDTLLEFMETIAHEKRHVTLAGATAVPVSGLRPGRDSIAADRASYRAEEILAVAEEIAVRAQALREHYIVPQEIQFHLFRMTNMLRGWITEAEYARIRGIIIAQLRARYGFESGACDNTITVGIVHSMENGEWHICNSATGQIVRPRPGLNYCEQNGRHRLCDLRAAQQATQSGATQSSPTSAPQRDTTAPP